MSDYITDLITSIWPDTEAKLEAETGLDYATHKTRAITRASKALYGEGTVPAEADIPQIARYWIADQAVVYLIPVARDWYMNHTRRSDSKENANFTFHDRLAALDRLKRELKADLKAGEEAALNAIDDTEAPDEAEDTPAVSQAGLLVEPATRAWRRGPF